MDRRFAIAAGLALAAGLAIGLVDSSPTWDDTGITVFALLIAGGLTAALGRRRPWLFALLVGGFVPAFEIPRGAGAGPLFALLFSAVGAGVGTVLGGVFDANL
jgi:hypothetical protein